MRLAISCAITVALLPVTAPLGPQIANGYAGLAALRIKDTNWLSAAVVPERVRMLPVRQRWLSHGVPCRPAGTAVLLVER